MTRLELVGADPGPQATPVVVLPYAGAVSSPAAVLRRGMRDDVAVFAAMLPGHGREPGPATDDPTPLLAGLDAALDELPADRPPPILIGISMGGRLAYELARQRTARGVPPAGLVVCASRAPHTGIGHPPLAAVAAADFGSAAAQLGLVAPELLGLAGADELLHTLRCDLAVVERMPPVGTDVLRLPATVIGADADWLVPEPALRRWGDLLADLWQLRILGSHLGWLRDPGPLCYALDRGIGRALDAIDMQ